MSEAASQRDPGPDAPADSPRVVAVISHPIREDAFDAAGEFIAGIAEQGVSSVVLADQRDALQQKVPGVPLTTIDPSEVNPRESRIEVVVVFGGDGTILRAAEWALPLSLIHI